MPPPKNGVYIVQGEIALVVTAMRRNTRWTSHNHQEDDQDPLLNSFSQLKDILNNITSLNEVETNVFLSPFLDVIRSEDTTGPITGLALSSVNKFLSYGLVADCESAAAAIENIADAVTHARFVGTDPGSDEVVLMKILHVLHTLLLTPAGSQLTNESVCEIMQSCFRICFEMRLSELLRKSAEHTLMDMVQLLFSRLPQFKEDTKWAANMKKLKLRTGGMDSSRSGKKKKSPKPKQRKLQQGFPLQSSQSQSPQPQAPGEAPRVESTVINIEKEDDPPVEAPPLSSEGEVPLEEVLPTPPPSEAASPEEPPMGMETIATTPVAPGGTMVDLHDSFKEASEQDVQQASGEDGDSSLTVPTQLQAASSETDLTSETDGHSCPSEHGDEQEVLPPSGPEHNQNAASEYINPRGVRFTPQQQAKEGTGPLIPYGLPCVRELFRFVISLTSPLDRHNTDVMIHMGLSLLTVALESGADHVASFNSLLYLVKDEMCRNLFFLLQSERLSLFAAAQRVCFMLFESMRSHLKFQLETYLTKMMDIIVSESPRISYDMRELTLESLVQLLRIPGLVSELYLNYDCDTYCSNVFEDLTKLLSKNAFPVAGLFSTHLLSLDALLTVIDSIEQHCNTRILNATKAPDGPSETRGVTFLISDDDEVAGDSGVTVEQETTPPPPPASGYAMAERMQAEDSAADTERSAARKNNKEAGTLKRPKIRANRMSSSTSVPTPEQLTAIKHRKKLINAGVEQFNIKPSKGIAFLQENGVLSNPLDPGEVITFIKESHRLDKKMIGEYISNKKNAKVLEAYQKSFLFEDTRIDESLRMYLESFRLPGEAPVISYILEHFAEHWHKTNGEPFANADAAFTLSYAVIMLNVDQHNHNAKKQNIPMTIAEFKKNLLKVNGGNDFDQDMLEEVYNAIKNDEIVMPAEQTGLVKENYLWKVLLRRGMSKEGLYVHVPTSTYDHDLFTLIWGPTVAALSFVFDKSLEETIIHKAISGFRKCAMISAHYGLSDVFDNLVISLCKFTTLLSSIESAETLPISFGNNQKAQLAAKTVFGLAHRHGDILREGWKNILDCMLQLYRAKLLPEILVKVEDFVDPNGKISLIREELPASRSESGVLSSFYSYFTMAETTTSKGPTPEEQEAIKLAHSCIKDCSVEQLLTESKFLRLESLQELIKALVAASQYPDLAAQEALGTNLDEDAAVFFLELLLRIVLQNRDRVGPIWQTVRDHIYNLAVNANEHTFLAERAVVGLIRLAIRLLRREEIAAQVLQSLRLLLMMKPNVIHTVSRQVAYGLHDLLRTNAANIHSSHDWYTLFTLLEVVGAGSNPPPIMQVGEGVNVQECVCDAGARKQSSFDSSGAQSDSEVSMSATGSEAGESRGYTSDSELYESQSKHHHSRSSEEEGGGGGGGMTEIKPIPSHGSWLLVNKDDVETNLRRPHPPVNQFTISLNEELRHQDTKALLKACETLAFLVRDAAHVTPHNFESCVHTIRTFVEASINGGRHAHKHRSHNSHNKKEHKHRRKSDKMKKSKSSPSHLAQFQGSDEEPEEGSTAAGFHSLSIQLLDLMHTLHTRAATIFSSWAEEEQSESETIDAGTGTLWIKCWCPILQGIARLCCDTRRPVRSQALTYLQRALLVHDLQTLSAVEWESCFNKVLFPLLSKLLDNINTQDPSGIEETRMRASTLLCKVFLQHLSPLLSLSTFTALWLTILEFMDKYMHADRSDLLCEAIPESLKNMLLVMYTAGILDGDDSQLWKLTWDRIDTFLPNLREDVFKPHESDSRRAAGREGASSPPPSGQTANSQPNQQVINQRSPEQAPEQQQQQQPNSQDQTPERPRPESPLTTEMVAPPTSSYILHPPLPSVASRSSPSGSPSTLTTTSSSGVGQKLGSVPILLNPDIMQSTTIPIISPQGTPERKTGVTADGQ